MLKQLQYRGMAGFSLVELMIGIAILGILLALGVPSYTAWIQNTRIRNAAESIQGGIQLARAEAVRRNTPVQFDLRGSASAWTVCVAPAVAGSCPLQDDSDTIQSRGVKEGSSDDIKIVASDATPFVFNSYGRLISPVPTGADGLVRVGVDIDTSVLSAAESRNLSIIIGVGGAARLCDPTLSGSGTDPRRCPPSA